MTVWNDTLVEPLAGDWISASDIHKMYSALKGVSDSWTAYTPVWTATGTQPALGNGTIAGAYHRVGKWVQARIVLTMGSTSTFGTNFYLLSLPVTAAATNQIGSAGLLDSGTADKAGSAYLFSTTQIGLLSATSAVSATTPHSWAQNDTIRVHISYEAA